MAAITTSLVVSLSTGDGAGDTGGILKIEVDNREDGFNKGKTQFRPGDNIYLLMYKSSNVTVTHILSSLGGISNTGTTTIPQTDFVAFANEPEATLSYPAVGTPSSSWAGPGLGGYSMISDSTYTLDNPPDPLVSTDPYVGVLRVKYTTQPIVLKLSNTVWIDPDTGEPAKEYEILVFVAGVVNG